MDFLIWLGGAMLACGAFLGKLLVGSLLFSTHFQRKKPFVPRLIVGFLACKCQ